MDFSLLATIALYAVPVLFAITLHEAAHGYVSRMFGDQTAWMLGRVTANPIKHIDPVGTLLVPGMLVAVAAFTHTPAFIFGWAKPVPVNFGNLRHPKRDMIWVAAAGPAVNFAMAILWALGSRLVAPSETVLDRGSPARRGHGLRDAMAVEVRKARSSRVLWSTGTLFVLGVSVLAVAMVSAVRSGNAEVVAKLGPPAATADWSALLSVAVQVSSAAGVLAFGVGISWLIGREFSDGTIPGLYGLPVSRGQIAAAKLLVYACDCLNAELPPGVQARVDDDQYLFTCEDPTATGNDALKKEKITASTPPPAHVLE